MILQLADTMLGEKLDRGLDLARQWNRILDGDAQHRLQRRFRERDDRTGAPALGEKLLDELEPSDLIGRIHAVTEAVTRRVRETVAALPHVELLAAQPGDANHLTDMQRAAIVGNSHRTDDRD